jgi:hypothetical protein
MACERRQPFSPQSLFSRRYECVRRLFVHSPTSGFGIIGDTLPLEGSTGFGFGHQRDRFWRCPNDNSAIHLPFICDSIHAAYRRVLVEAASSLCRAGRRLHLMTSLEIEVEGIRSQCNLANRLVGLFCTPFTMKVRLRLMIELTNQDVPWNRARSASR